MRCHAPVRQQVPARSHLRNQGLVDHLPDTAHVRVPAVRIQDGGNLRRRHRQVGVGDDRVRIAAGIGEPLQPARLTDGVRMIVLGLYMDRFDHRKGANVAPKVLDEIVAPDLRVFAEHPRSDPVG